MVYALEMLKHTHRAHWITRQTTIRIVLGAVAGAAVSTYLLVGIAATVQCAIAMGAQLVLQQVIYDGIVRRGQAYGPHR